MKALPRFFLVLLSAVLVGMVCVPPGQASKHSARQSRRAHRSLSQRPGRAVHFPRQSPWVEAVARNGAAPQSDAGAGSHAEPLFAGAPVNPLSPPRGRGLALGESAQDFASPARWVLFCRLLL
jgi:hypothetical protein